ncbi:aspartic peptidase domain-containing protein [Podospora conica]|nr:aspartic peptidase domain-containing protein [Schizothecium conicum]
MRLASGSLLVLLASGAAAQNVVEFDLHRGFPGINVGVLPHLSPRATQLQELANNITGSGYYCEVQVGTPPQTVNMLIDTGSSDTWVVSPRADLCSSKQLQFVLLDSCSATYDETKSSTFKMIQKDGFNITYLDRRNALGDYISDDFTVAGITINDLQLGLVTKAPRGTGIMGIGYSANVATLNEYPNIIDQLVLQKRIAVKAYSLFLNDRRSSSGSILFGGVDTGKFVGPLSILPILRPADAEGAEGQHIAFAVSLTGLGALHTDGAKADFNPSLFDAAVVPAVLDSGSTLSYLPAKLTAPLYKHLGAVFERLYTNMTFVDCRLLASDPDLEIAFSFHGGATVRVPVTEVVLDVLAPLHQTLLASSFPGFQKACLFGVQSTASIPDSAALQETTFSLLGDTFLRSAYVVYDLDHHQIGIAQANLNSTQSNVVELKAGAPGLPSLMGVKEQERKSGAPGGVRVAGGREALVLGVGLALLGSRLW